MLPNIGNIPEWRGTTGKWNPRLLLQRLRVGLILLVFVCDEHHIRLKHVDHRREDSSIVEGLERRGRHNVNRVAVSCVVLNNELFIFVYPLQHMVVDQHMTQPFLFRCLNH